MHLLDDIDLGHGFRKHFMIRPALGAEQRAAVRALRRQAGREGAQSGPVQAHDGEADEDDANSLHCLLGTAAAPPVAVACARLILVPPNESGYRLPFERNCASALERAVVDPARLAREPIGEACGPVVAAAFRHRRGKAGRTDGVGHDALQQDLPSFPYIPVSLYLGVLALASRTGVDTLFALASPPLLGQFARLGIDMRPVGQPVFLHGPRVPAMIDVPAVLRQLRPALRPLWRVIRDEIEHGFAAHAGLTAFGPSPPAGGA